MFGTTLWSPTINGLARTSFREKRSAVPTTAVTRGDDMMVDRHVFDRGGVGEALPHRLTERVHPPADDGADDEDGRLEQGVQ